MYGKTKVWVHWNHSFDMHLGLPWGLSWWSICLQCGDLGLIPGLGKSTGEGIGYPLQYSWASLVAQLVKNPPAVWETWVQSLGWEDPQEKGKATHSSILAWRIPWTVQSMGSQRVGHDWATFPFTYLRPYVVVSHPEFPQGSPWGVAAVQCLLYGGNSFLPELSQGSLPHVGGLQCWWLWHPMFSNMAGNIPFLTLWHPWFSNMAGNIPFLTLQ